MNETIEILIIDDDQNHLSILKEKLESLSYSNIITALGCNAAETYLSSHVPDLIIIDYYLDRHLTAVDFVKNNLTNKPIPVIVISTFHNEKVFKDILPICPIDFISKSCSEFELRKAIELSLIKTNMIKKNSKLESFFFVKVGLNIRKIDVNEIEVVEVDGKYLNLHVNGRQFVVRSTLNDFHKKLPENFIKVHQSFVININYVETVNLDEQKIKLKNAEAYFSRNYRKLFLNSNHLFN